MFLVIGVHWFGSLAGSCPQEGTCPAVFDFLGKLTSLGVPLFFSLSGYYILGKEITSIKDFYFKRFVRVMVPYLLYAVFYVFYFTVFEDHKPVMLVKNYVVNVLTGNVHPTHWFVYSILGLYFATPFLSRMFRTLSDREVALLYFSAVSFELVNCIFGIFGRTFGINMYVFSGSILTFMSGYCMQRCFNMLNVEQWKYTKVCRVIAILSLFTLYCFTKWYILLTIIVGLAVAGNKQRVETRGAKGRVIRVISQYSYSVYLIHAAVISAVFRIYTGWGNGNLGLKTFAGYIVVFGVSFIFTLIFDNICTNRIMGTLNQFHT